MDSTAELTPVNASVTPSPPPQLLPYLFTKETASEMGKRGAAAIHNPKPEPTPIVTPAAQPDVTAPMAEVLSRAQRLSEQLDDLQDQIDAADEPKTLRDLYAAFKAGMDVWCRLTGLEREAIRRPSKPASRVVNAEPVD